MFFLKRENKIKHNQSKKPRERGGKIMYIVIKSNQPRIIQNKKAVYKKNIFLDNLEGKVRMKEIYQKAEVGIYKRKQESKKTRTRRRK